MPVLTPGKTVRGTAPTLLVENPFEAGDYVFRLEVVGQSAQVSPPVNLTVRVFKPLVVRPVVTPVAATTIVKPTPVASPTVATPIKPIKPIR